MKKSKKLLTVTCIFIFAVSMTFVVYAGSLIRESNTHICYSACGKKMGIVGLSSAWRYSDGLYVEFDSCATVYYPNPEYNYGVVFFDLEHTDYSCFSASVSCSYLVTDDICTEGGYLVTYCDTYGETENAVRVMYQTCNH